MSHIRYNDYEVQTGITSHLLERLKLDPNCKRSMMGKELQDIINEYCRWHSLIIADVYVGAVLVDEHDCHHIYLLEAYKNREDALILTELSCYLSRATSDRFIHTTVLDTPQYKYMHKFLEDCGFVYATDTLPTGEPYRIYSPTRTWNPPHVPTLTICF